MKELFKLVAPKTVPVLDPDFRPPVLANRAFLAEVDATGKAVPFIIAVERDQNRVSRFATRVFPMDHPRAGANYFYVERILKFLLWQFGGWKVTIFGPKELVGYLASCYTNTGIRRFDAEFWGDQTYEHEMQIIHVAREADLPAENDGAGSAVELDWKGWRIGFDLGASDRKVAVAKVGKLALKANGEPVLSEEYVWDPKPQTNIKYHYDEINWVLKEAEKAIKAIDPQAKVEA
ncbi:MAG: hypothetical protein J6T06_14830, partial [Victivallales bacterium]|nr:hypothetical protein [Victivallales bacterium]